MAKENMKGWLNAILSFIKKNWLIILGIIAAAIFIPQITASIRKLFSLGSDTLDQAAKGLKAAGIGDSEGIKTFKALSSDPNGTWSPHYVKNAPAGAKILPYSTKKDFSKKLHKSWDFFSKDFETTMGVFHQLSAKTQVSDLADQFYQDWGQDLLTFLRPATWSLNFRNYMSSDNFIELTNYVNNLKQM
jgi:hypothetical protein